MTACGGVVAACGGTALCGVRLAKLGGACVGAAACGGTLTGSTLGAPSLIGNDAGEAYYAFEVAPAQPLSDVTFDSCGSNFDTYLWLVRLVGDDAWEEVTACDYCGCTEPLDYVRHQSL